jgi:hypothetical protein
MRRVLRSRKFWGGAVAGMIVGPWALGQLKRITGVSLGLPSVGGSG